MKRKILSSIVLAVASLATCLGVFAAINSGWPYASQQWPGFGAKRNIVQWVITAVTDGASSDLLPGVTATNNIGSSTYRVKGLYTTTVDVSGAMTLGGLTLLQADAAPRTNITPGRAGAIIWNSADAQLCVSTGTVKTTWVQAADGSTACSH